MNKTLADIISKSPSSFQNPPLSSDSSETPPELFDPLQLQLEADKNLSAALTNARSTSASLDYTQTHVGFLATEVGLCTLVLLRALEGYLYRPTRTSPCPSTNLNYSKPSASSSPQTEPTAKTTLQNNLQRCAKVLADTFQNAINVDAHLSRQNTDGLIANDDGSEVLYGRAGLLYALLLLRQGLERRMVQNSPGSTAPTSESGDTRSESDRDLERFVGTLTSDGYLLEIVKSIIKRGEYGASLYTSEFRRSGTATRASLDSLPSLMWSWHGKRYLGAAHGVAGILHILLLCPTAVISPYTTAILQTAKWLISCQDSMGNWPTKAPGAKSQRRSRHKETSDENELVHWCHGAPGILHFLCKLYQKSQTNSTLFPLSQDASQSLLRCIKRGANLVYERGFLRKGVGLCHGLAGSIYTLLAVSDGGESNQDGARDSESLYFRYALHLAYLGCQYERLTEEGEMDTPDRPLSLYEGLAGMCCAWAEVLRRLDFDERGARSRDQNSSSSRPVGFMTTRRMGIPGFDNLD
ncbi:hypothetical protein BDN72DRAFT_765824 [Pluteus cervinus]|uniref:Uncharacterized protein n=1 Tax=Pluteus cervinus TaxID=181527 RepID=A0ACD3AYK7_9AGAR|nr:hypothetical protein BDN72DRAFT_765824 [Pluteus cervinus]